MAIRYAVATGNWSTTTTWNGGTLPTSDDDVYSNNFTVTINQNVTVLSIRNTSNASPVVAQGGGFIISDSTLTITASSGGFMGGATATLMSYAGSTPLVLNGNLSSLATTNGVVNLLISGTGSLTINGNVSGSTGVNNGNNHCIQSTNASGGTIAVVGNVTAGSWNLSHGILTSGADASVTVTGTVSGYPSGNNNATSSIYTTGVRASVTIIGSVIGQFTTCVTVTGANSAITITGNVTGGTNTGIVAVACTGTSATVSITGNITANSSAAGATPAVSLSGNSPVKWHSIIGTVTSAISAGTLGSHGIRDSNTSGGGVAVGGSLIDSAQGDCAVNTRRFRCIPTLNTVRQHANNTGYPNGGMVTYGSLDYITNNVPIPANVRRGVVYGDNSFTGTMAIPNPSSVNSGIPVDATTGIAALSLSDVAAQNGLQLIAIGGL